MVVSCINSYSGTTDASENGKLIKNTSNIRCTFFFGLPGTESVKAFEHDRVVEELLAALAVEHVGRNHVEVRRRQLRLERPQLLLRRRQGVAVAVGGGAAAVGPAEAGLHGSGGGGLGASAGSGCWTGTPVFVR